MKRILAFLLLMTLLLTQVVAFAETESTELTYGELLKEIGLISGNENGLEEHKSLSRQELVAILNRIAPNQEEYKNYVAPGTPSFSDVPKTHWAYRDIEFAKANNVTSGIGDGKFGFDQHVTANQAAMFFSNSLGYGDFNKTMLFNNAYADVATKLNISVSSNIAGLDTLTRGEVFELMTKTLATEDVNSQFRIDNIISDESTADLFWKTWTKAKLASNDEEPEVVQSGTVKFNDIANELTHSYSEYYTRGYDAASKASFTDEYDISYWARTKDIRSNVDLYIDTHLNGTLFSKPTDAEYATMLDKMPLDFSSIGAYVDFNSDDIIFIEDINYLSLTNDGIDDFINNEISSSEGMASDNGKITAAYINKVNGSSVYLIVYDTGQTLDGKKSYISFVLDSEGNVTNSILVCAYATAYNK